MLANLELSKYSYYDQYVPPWHQSQLCLHTRPQTHLHVHPHASTQKTDKALSYLSISAEPLYTHTNAQTHNQVHKQTGLKKKIKNIDIYFSFLIETKKI